MSFCQMSLDQKTLHAPQATIFFLLFLIIGQYYKLFTAVIMLLAACFSMILTELCQKRRNYGRKKYYNIGHRPCKTEENHKSSWVRTIITQTQIRPATGRY